MSFIWTEDISIGAAANAAGMNEVQTNLDTIYTALGITRAGCGSGAGWTEFPITGGLVTDKLSVQPQQLRDVTDYAYDNKCPAYNSGYQAGVDTTEDTGYNNGYQAGVDATYNLGYFSDQHTTYKSGDQVGVDATYNLGYFSDQHTSYLNADLTGVDATYNPSYCSGYDGSYCPSHQISVLSVNNLTVS